MVKMKVARTNAELVKRLQKQLRLLKEALDKAKLGKLDYLDVISSRLRILVVRKENTNKPLLFDLSEIYGVKLSVNVNGPPFKSKDLSLEDYIEKKYYFHSTTENIHITNKEFINIMAEQEGGSHEDWSADKGFLLSKNGFYIDGKQPHIRNLINLGDAVYVAGVSFLKQIKS